MNGRSKNPVVVQSTRLDVSFRWSSVYTRILKKSVPLPMKEWICQRDQEKVEQAKSKLPPSMSFVERLLAEAAARLKMDLPTSKDLHNKKSLTGVPSCLGFHSRCSEVDRIAISRGVLLLHTLPE